MQRHTQGFLVNSAAIIDSRPIFRMGLGASLAQIQESAKILEFSHYTEVSEIPSEVIFLFGGDLSDSEILISIKNLHRANIHSKIVLYDYRHSLNFLLSCFHEPLNGYLPGNFSNSDLQDCLLCLEKNKMYLNSEVAYQILITNINTKEKSKKIVLSSLETKVADYLLRGMGTTQIAGLMDRRPSTISTVKAKIFKKAKVDNVIDLATVMVYTS